jgi:hypothetical protein
MPGGPDQVAVGGCRYWAVSYSGDFFAGTATVRSSGPAQVGPPQTPKGRFRPRLLIAATVVVLGGILVVGILPTDHKSTVSDSRPIGVPASLGGVPLRMDADAAGHAEEMLPILKKIFGAKVSTSAMYGRPLTVPQVYVLAGRGRIDHAKAGDVHLTSRDRRHFGDVTCADMMYKGTDLRSVDVCWYSSATFGASVTYIGDPSGKSAAHAQALEQALPILRGDQNATP